MIRRFIACCKGKSREQFLAEEISRLESKVNELADYEPNALTFIRDTAGFGRLDLALSYYGLNGIMVMFLIGSHMLGYISSSHMYSCIEGVLVLPVIAAPVGIYLRRKYPVTRSYFLSFGKK